MPSLSRRPQQPGWAASGSELLGDGSLFAADPENVMGVGIDAQADPVSPDQL